MNEVCKSKLVPKKIENNDRLQYAFNNGLIVGLVGSLIKNRMIFWAILNGNISDINSVVLETAILIIGGILGSYAIGWYWDGRKKRNINKLC